jgi:hypothetical protein
MKKILIKLLSGASLLALLAVFTLPAVGADSQAAAPSNQPVSAPAAGASKTSGAKIAKKKKKKKHKKKATGATPAPGNPA